MAFSSDDCFLLLDQNTRWFFCVGGDQTPIINTLFVILMNHWISNYVKFKTK